MTAQPLSSPLIAHYPVLVRPEPVGQFTAQPLGLPDIQAVAASEQEALELVQQALARHAGSLHWVPVASAVGTSAVPPAAGHAKDDPDHDQYLEEIQRFRHEAEARACSSSSSTPIT
jgi:predicted RNase H-like HicB family nuclease